MSNPTAVSDLLSNHNDNLATAAKLLGRSQIRIGVFEAVYKGKKAVKTIQEIMDKTGKTKRHVLTEGRKLVPLLLEKVPDGYKKRSDLAPKYKEIISLAKNPKKLAALPTKVSHKTGKQVITVKFPNTARNAQFVTINEIASFSKTRNVSSKSEVGNMKEAEIKQLFKDILKDGGKFKDWGGEKSDLYSTKLKLKSTRLRCAIAFKGRGTKGKLMPNKMGKNGDQITRLFDEPADVYLVVYNGQIDSSIVAQMQACAIAKAVGGQKNYYGIIDADDLGLLKTAYENK